MPVEATEALPDCPVELETLLHQVRDRVRRHRDTADMRLANCIERRLAERGIQAGVHAANANAERQAAPMRRSSTGSH